MRAVIRCDAGCQWISVCQTECKQVTQVDGTSHGESKEGRRVLTRRRYVCERASGYIPSERCPDWRLEDLKTLGAKESLVSAQRSMLYAPRLNARCAAHIAICRGATGGTSGTWYSLVTLARCKSRREEDAGLPSGDMFASVQVVVHGYDSLRVQVNGKRRHGDKSLRAELLTVVPLLGIADAWGAEVRL